MSTGRGCCQRCGAQLRRDRRRSGVLCDPCRRVGPDPRRELPAGFYFQKPMADALADYDFGDVFRQVRAATGWSQQTLAGLVGLDQSRISAIERGVSGLRDVALVAQLAKGLWIPPVLLGFGTTVDDARGARGKLVSWVDRRDFVQHVAALAMGATGAAGLDIDRLTALLPHADPIGTRHVGASDVAVIEQATAAFVRQDYATGAGPVRDLAVAQLRSVLPLLGAQMSPEVRPRLCLATAHLALTAGWLSFDVNEHDAARRLWMIGLDVARACEDPRGADLTVYLLHDMALQAIRVSGPDEALRLVQLGHTAAIGSDPVSAATTSLLVSTQARAHATKGDTAACARALGQAEEHFSAIDPATRPPWGVSHDEVSLAAKQGGTYYILAGASGDPRVASRAVPLLRHAVDSLGPDYARPRALFLTHLTGAHAIAGDADTAVTVGHQAIDAVTALHSPRAYDQLRVLNTALEPSHASPGVTELRGRLTAVTAH